MGEEEEMNRRKEERKEKERNMTGPRYGGEETSFINMWEGIAGGRVQTVHDPEPCEEKGGGEGIRERKRTRCVSPGAQRFNYIGKSSSASFGMNSSG